MLTLRRLRAYIAWLALCAMCFGAFAPTVSKWLVANQTNVRIQLCSAAGRDNIAIALQTGEFPSAPSILDDACAYCALAHHTPFIPPAATALSLAIVTTRLPYTNVAIDAGHIRIARRAHTPRAPPALA